jgi:DNA mismatch repair protein MutS
VERQVMRIVTPGTISDESLLEERKDNLLVAIYAANGLFGFSVMDMASGRFGVFEVNNAKTAESELYRLQPAELLLDENCPIAALKNYPRGLRLRPSWEFDF